MRYYRFLFIVLTYLSSVFVAYGDGLCIVDPYADIYLTLEHSDVVVEVSNQIATTTSTQIYQNNTGETVEFQYAFPLPANANPIGLRWYYEGEWHEAVYSPDEQDDSVVSGDGAWVNELLADYLGETPMFFNPSIELPDGAEYWVELTYVELLPYEFGVVNYTYKHDISAFQSEPLQGVDFSFLLTSDREILSAELLGLESDDLQEPFFTELIYLSSGDYYADYNYEVNYELSSEDLGLIPLSTFISDSLFACDTLGKGYVSMIIEPESNVDTEVIEKNFTLVIDRSGSMGGDKIVQARNAASFIVNNLNFGDKFNVIDFSDVVNPLFPDHVEYNLDNQVAALAYIEGLSSGGSTNISGALSTAISQFDAVDVDKANIILFFTDGEATQGETSTAGILNIVEEQIALTETSVFLFTFGIGEYVNKALLTLLAQQNKGLSKFIEEDALEAEITKFFLTINNPVLINTSVSFTPDVVDDIYPVRIPNLYQGQQLIVSGRYEGAEDVVMHIEGQAFNVPVSYDFPVSLASENEEGLSVLPKLWAKQKIDDLSLEYYLAETSEEGEDIQNEIDATSDCYQVVAVDFGSYTDGVGLEIDEDYVGRDALLIYPKPFTDRMSVRLSISYTLSPVTIQIVDSEGRVVYQQFEEIAGSTADYDIKGLGALAPGVYICRVIIGDRIETQRIVKL